MCFGLLHPTEVRFSCPVPSTSLRFAWATFLMVKLRTMREAFDLDGHPLPDSQRMTPFGRFLRESSLDELPELWNVLMGDMSLVGLDPCWPNICLCILLSKIDAMRFALALQVGLRSTVAMPFHGKKDLNLIFGMLITLLFSLIYPSFSELFSTFF